MRTVFRIRWALTCFLLELLVRVLFFSAIFRRPAPARLARITVRTGEVAQPGRFGV